MNILIYRWDIFPYNDIIETLQNQGHHFDVLDFVLDNNSHNKAFEQIFSQKVLSCHYDAVFSINYFTIISDLCHRFHIKYISWTCDAPLLSMRHPSVNNSENKIYLFDKSEYNYFISKKLSTVDYLPLAGNPQRIQKQLKNIKPEYKYDLSFVGNLYDKNRYDELVSVIPDYICGYMDAAIEAQLNVSGGNLLPKMLTDEIISLLEPYIRLKKEALSTSDLRLHVATSVLSYKTAAIMRKLYLNSLAEFCDVNLFTTSDTSDLTGVNVHPPVRYADEMPLVFAQSKININMTIPNIENGIPLRVFDILSASGFVLTDYREETLEFFEPDTDLVVYDGLEDMLAKALYYLKNDTKRELIARNGYNKLCKFHTYKDRVRELF